MYLHVRAEMGDIWAAHRQTAEHAEQQAEVIRQLQRLQSDTQQSKLSHGGMAPPVGARAVFRDLEEINSHRLH